MDELEFNPDAASTTDTTLEMEGYDDQVEMIENAYPEEDFRTPLEIQAEQEQQLENVTPPKEVTPEPIEEPARDFGAPRFQDMNGMLNVEEVLSTGVDPQLAERAKIQYQLDDTELNLFADWREAGGQNNVEATYNLVNTIRNDELLTAKYDRNGDGQVSFSDWFDVSRFGEMTPERDQQLTEFWLSNLENKTLITRIPAIFNAVTSGLGPAGIGMKLDAGRFLQPMVPYMHQRRKGILGSTENLKGEQTRSNLLAGLTETTGAILSAPEKIYTGFADAASDNDDETWFNWDAFEKKDAVLDDIVFNHKNPNSYGYGVTNPINRVWSDETMFEVGRYAPAIAASFLIPGGATAISTGGAGLKTAKGIGVAGLTTARAFGVTWATETIPTNLFADMNSNAMKTFHSSNPQAQKIMSAHPELHGHGMQLAHGVESPFSRKLEFMRSEMTWDAGGLLFGQTLFRTAGKFLPQLAEKNWKALRTSTNAKPKASKNPIDIWNTRKQVLDDSADAAIDQSKIASEGPSSKWQDPWGTDADFDSTYGSFKNEPTISGQGSAGIRSGIEEITDQVDEIKGQVGIEGGTVDEVFTPIERAEFSKSGIPDPWDTDAATKYWGSDNVQAKFNELNPLDRNIKNMAKGTLENIQEILNRDFTKLSPEEFWPKEFLETKLKAGKTLDEVKAFTIKNLQVKDGVIRSLLTRLRDYSDAAGEQLGKGDIFAKEGPMSNIAKNLAMGLSEIKKTQLTWNTALKQMDETGGQLTKAQIKQIDDIVAAEQGRITQETYDGVRLMMQVLEGSDSDELAEGILDVFKVSNDIQNWKDFDAWMRSQIRGGKFNGKPNTGVMLSELQAVMVNSILSGPKTPLRALLGTTTNSYLNALNEAVGASIRAPFTGDVASKTASIAKLKGMFELVPEAFTVFRKNMKAKWNADIADVRTRYSDAPSRGDKNWHLYGKWTERNGTMADKAAYGLANVARTLNNNKLFTWSPRAMAAIDDTFKWLLARTRAKEMGFRNALEGAGGDFSKLTPEVLQKSEEAYESFLKDADGNLDVVSDTWLKKQYEEVTLTSELKGFSAELDEVFRKVPLITPFYLFARTGINGLNFTYKNTPLLGALHKESIDILRHTGDDYTKLFKYGIENANDLANARNLFAGRQAVGAATVLTMAGMYQAGQLTGNGPADRQLKQQWINGGWKPNHLYIGDVGFDYRSLEPFNTIFATIADIGDNMELMGTEWAEKRLQATAFVIGRGLQSKTYLQGIDQMMQIAQMKPGSFDKAAGNIMNNSLPLAGMRNEFGKWINPHMKELNSDMWSSIRNRNQFMEAFSGDKLPSKSDILNGKPINNWNIIGRSFNAVSPIQVDIRNDTPGRRLLLDSNYDLKSTTYAYGGYSFAKSAKVRAHFQNAIGNAPITVGFKKFKNPEEALNYLASRKDVKNSMAQLKGNINNPENFDINPNTYPHNTLIDQVFNQARSKAWATITQPDHPAYSAVQKVMAEKDGHTSRTRENRNEILELSFPKKTVDNFPKN